ncbi:MAG: deoxyribodipyrimidine photo-lyase [Saprospiraceae bacterium]|nr:deoxyribodipyrimidine photo-lyase [Saprospiraceae bacterium]
MALNIFWFRRDLRLNDNAGLYHALKSGQPVLPLFIFDQNILDDLDDPSDARVTFLHDTLTELKAELEKLGSTLLVIYGKPVDVWRDLVTQFDIKKVFTNHDYEPYALQRDTAVKQLLNEKDIDFQTFKDHVIFEKSEVVKDDGLPYTVFTPYSRKWRAKLDSHLVEHNGQQVSFYLKPYPTEKYFDSFAQTEVLTTDTPLSKMPFPTLNEMGFQRSTISIPTKVVMRSVVKNYDKTRDFPALVQGTSRLGIHFRFGTISIREKALAAQGLNDIYLNELIWRDFYSMILQHFPHIGAGKAFRPEYDLIQWENDEKKFQKWCEGKTGYPLVDAGMRELNATGHMHNRVRMVVSSFLTKHLLIDWRWGEAYFAQKLLDFDFASNNGGWQWASGSGTDAAPYFRIFNPEAQLAKFDKDGAYTRRWVPEWPTPQYNRPIVDHKMAREKCLATYAAALKPKTNQ